MLAKFIRLIYQEVKANLNFQELFVRICVQ
jgi:hypothetical protein